MVFLRKIVIAGISGFACGSAYSQLKKHPKVVVPIIQGAVLAGACGSVLGLGISAYRNLPTHIYAISLGANFAVTTGAFLGIRHWTLQYTGQSDSLAVYSVITSHGDYVASSVSGGLTGTLISLITWKGIGSLFYTTFAGLLVGLTAQYGYNSFEKWRKQKAIELSYPELREKREEWNLANFQKHWLGFWHKQSNAAAIEQDIILLQDSIRTEQERIERANKRLEKHELTKLHRTQTTNERGEDLSPTTCTNRDISTS